MIIKNGRVAFPGEKDFQLIDLEIAQGKISRTGHDLSGNHIIYANDLLALPGGIDPHVHFNEPGYTDREDFYHGSSMAAAGGVTTVIDMPCTSLPPVTNLKNLRQKLHIVSQRAVVDFGFFGGVSAQSYAKNYQVAMAALADHVLGYKTYFISGMESFKQLTPTQFFQVLKSAEKVRRPVLLHAEDLATIRSAEEIEKRKGSGWDNYYRSRPESAEIIAVQKAIELVRRTKAQLHIVHIGTANAAQLINGEPRVSGETAPHYLAFSCQDLEQIGGALKTAPVVKSPGNTAELWHLLNDGTIDFVASDHAPGPYNQKNTGSAWTDYAGIPGTGTLLPYLLSEGLLKRRMDLDRFLAVIAENAARRYGLFGRKGSLEVDKDADLVLVDPQAEWKVHGKHFYSKGKLTPFEGMVFKGRIVKTILRGKIIYDYNKGICALPGSGEFLKPYSKG